jgi:L-ascorbate metabolism protein UlaG (beta-lactamase superfamily)
MKFTYWGHSCFSLEIKGQHLLFDPFISGNPLAADIDHAQIPADFVLLSHGHFDHVADAEAILKRTGASLISNYEIVSWYQQKGIEKAHPMNIGGKWSFEFGTVKSVAAVHSSVMPDGTYAGNPGGFLIRAAGKTIYYAGDTALSMDMKILPETGWKPDVAILPVGDNFTMGYEDAAFAAGFVNCKQVIGVHFDTFGFIKIDHQKAKQHFESKGLSLSLPGIGESIEL